MLNQFAAAITHPDFDPVAIDLGFVQVHWYGIMYLLGFIAAWLLGRQRVKKAFVNIRGEHVEDIIFYAAMGVVLGGRLGYVLFYQFEAFLRDPLWLFKINQGGMSFHGGLLGVIFALWLFSRKHKLIFGEVMDFAAYLTPIGLGLGRLGNFIGQELWGRTTDVPWGMIFATDPERLVRHPSQLYQAALEGVALFALLYWYSRKYRPPWATSGVFLIGYAVFRFAVEFVRQPDAHLSYMFGWMTRGQLLCIPMVLLGLWLIYNSHQKQALAGNRHGAKSSKA